MGFPCGLPCVALRDPLPTLLLRPELWLLPARMPSAPRQPAGSRDVLPEEALHFAAVNSPPRNRGEGPPGCQPQEGKSSVIPEKDPEGFAHSPMLSASRFLWSVCPESLCDCGQCRSVRCQPHRAALGPVRGWVTPHLPALVQREPRPHAASPVTTPSLY